MSVYVNKITLDGLHSVYHVGEKIDFKIIFKGFVTSCGSPHVKIVNSTNNTIWESGIVLLLCDPDMGRYPVYVNQTYQLSGNGLGGPVVIDKPGNYSAQVSFYDKILHTNFVVVPSKNG